MSTKVSAHASLIDRFRIHLKTEAYSLSIQKAYPMRLQHFLEYCDSNGLSIEAVRSCHVDEFVRGRYQHFRKRHGQSLRFQEWRKRYTGPVHLLLDLVHGRWPVPNPPATALEAFHREIVQGYDTWLRDLRGLHALTRNTRTAHALRFLTALGPNADQETLGRLSVRDVDAYLKECCKGRRRATIADYTVCLRDFLRHLHRNCAMQRDRAHSGQEDVSASHVLSGCRGDRRDPPATKPLQS